MGYKRNTNYRLKFEDPDLEGLEVVVKPTSVGKMLDLAKFAAIDVDNLHEGDSDIISRMFQDLADHIVEWNLEDEFDNPVKPTYENLLNLDSPFVFAIVNAWMEKVAGIPAPKGLNSNGGSPSQEESLPMEPL